MIDSFVRFHYCQLIFSCACSIVYFTFCTIDILTALNLHVACMFFTYFSINTHYSVSFSTHPAGRCVLLETAYTNLYNFISRLCVSCQNGSTDRAGFWHGGFPRLDPSCIFPFLRNSSGCLRKTSTLCSNTLLRTLDLETLGYDASIVASDVNLARPTSVHRCVQHDGRDTARRAGPSASAETFCVSFVVV